MRLINADELIRMIDVGHLRLPTEMCFNEIMIKNIIDNCTIYSTNGKWIPCESSEHWKCDQCGVRSPMYWDGENIGYVEWLSLFCPNCGCLMQGYKGEEK